jgi:methionyl-tRNA formyltransferase
VLNDLLAPAPLSDDRIHELLDEFDVAVVQHCRQRLPGAILSTPLEDTG